MFPASCDGAVDEGRGESFGEGSESGTQDVREAEGLRDDATELVVNGGIAVGLVMLLVADTCDREQARGGEPGELTLNGSDADAGVADDLVGVEGAVGAAEEQAEDALLGAGEEGVREGVVRRSQSHNGNDSTQDGNGQMAKRESLATRRMQGRPR